MARPPMIGITAGNHPKQPDHYILRWDYVRAVDQMGGIPVILAPSPAARHHQYIESFDGLIFSGGYDINPKRYGQQRHESIVALSEERDEFEWILMEKALHREMPILAICRGMQLLNVMQGGTLFQDLPTQFPSKINHDDEERDRRTIAHGVRFEKRTHMSSLFGDMALAVNSFHRQGIDRLGRDLKPAGYADDGLIEAVELVTHPFVVGVQWHPESLAHRAGPYTLLFKSLVEWARG